jgi:hypothetical protein
MSLLSCDPQFKRKHVSPQKDLRTKAWHKEGLKEKRLLDVEKNISTKIWFLNVIR